MNQILNMNREIALLTVKGKKDIVRITDPQSALAQITMDIFQTSRIDKHRHAFAIHDVQ